MRNIPLFTTEYGVANLLLKNVPYTDAAYIQLLSARDYMKLLQECCNFCKMVGAKMIYVSGNECLKELPLYTQILSMSRRISGIPVSDCILVSVNKETSESWRELYNSRMRGVPAADHMLKSDMAIHLSKADCYYVYCDDQLLGIGIASGERVDAVIGLQPHVGQKVLTALCGALSGDTVYLKVASENLPAVILYEKMGFKIDSITEEWYDATEFSLVSRKST